MQQAIMLRPQGPPAYALSWVVEKRSAKVVEFLAWPDSPYCSLVSPSDLPVTPKRRTSYCNGGPVRRQRSLDRPGGLNKGEFLAHRNVHRSEDETANPTIEGTG